MSYPRFSTEEVWSFVKEGAHAIGAYKYDQMEPELKAMLDALLSDISSLPIQKCYRDEDSKSAYTAIGEILANAYANFGSDEWQTDIPGAFFNWRLGYWVAEYICLRVQKEAFVFRMDKAIEYPRNNLENEAAEEKKNKEAAGE